MIPGRENGHTPENQPISRHRRSGDPHTPISSQVYELDVDIWPTCIVVPCGYRISLSVQGRDYVYPSGSGGRLWNMKNGFTGCEPFLHSDPRDRPPKIFGEKVTLHAGADWSGYVLLPIVP